MYYFRSKLIFNGRKQCAGNYFLIKRKLSVFVFALLVLPVVFPDESEKVVVEPDVVDRVIVFPDASV